VCIFIDNIDRLEEIGHGHSTPPERRVTQGTGEQSSRPGHNGRNVRLTFQRKVRTDFIDFVVVVDVGE